MKSSSLNSVLFRPFFSIIVIFIFLDSILFADTQKEFQQAAQALFDGRVAATEGDFDLALKKFDVALKTYPNYADLHVFKKIIQDHRNGIIDKEHTIKLFDIINFYYHKENTKAQLRINNFKLKDYVPAIYISGRISLQRNKINAALQEFNKAIQLDPDYIYYYFLRGTIYKSQKKLNLAFKDFKKITRINAGFTPAYIQCGQIATDLKNYKEAIYNFDFVKDYLKGNLSEMQYFEALNNYGTHLMEQTEYDKAVELFSRAIHISSSYDQPFLNRGISYKNIGKFEKSVYDFNKVLEMDQDNSDAIYYRAMVYKEMKNYEQALKDLDKIKYDKNKQKFVYKAIGEIYIKRKNFDSAIQYFNRLLQIDPMNVWGHYWIALAYDKKKEYKNAIRYYKKFLEIAPKQYFKQIVFVENRIRKIKR